LVSVVGHTGRRRDALQGRAARPFIWPASWATAPSSGSFSRWWSSTLAGPSRWCW